MTSDLNALLARVREAKEGSRELDYLIFTQFAEKEVFSIWDPKEGNHFTSSLDAALALAERVLPGFYWGVSLGMMSGTSGPYWAEAYSLGEPLIGWEEDLEPVQTPGATPALALVAATLSALLAQQEAASLDKEVQP